MSSRLLIDELLARLPEARGSEGAAVEVLPAPLRARMERDPAARLLWDRLVLHLRAMDSLSRVSAPSELDGRVVAALNNGYLQDRAVDHVRSVERQEVPASLDARVRRLAERPFALPGASAPSVLDRLVELEVEDSAGLTRRLIDRVSGEGRVRKGILRLVGSAVAAGLVVAAFLAADGLGGSSSPTFATDALRAGITPGHTGKIQFVRVESAADAPEALAGLLDQVTGGALGGRRESR